MQLALKNIRGRTGLWKIAVLQADGTPQNITGLTLWFRADVGGVTIAKTSPSGGIAITNASGGLATLKIDPADTDGIPASGVYGGPCELVMQDGIDSYPLGDGTIVISPNCD